MCSLFLCFHDPVTSLSIYLEVVILLNHITINRYVGLQLKYYPTAIGIEHEID